MNPFLRLGCTTISSRNSHSKRLTSHSVSFVVVYVSSRYSTSSDSSSDSIWNVSILRGRFSDSSSEDTSSSPSPYLFTFPLISPSSSSSCAWLKSLIDIGAYRLIEKLDLLAGGSTYLSALRSKVLGECLWYMSVSPSVYSKGLRI